MRWQPIPHHQQLARQVTQQVAEEVHHPGRADGAGVEPEVEVPPSDAGGGRQHLPIEVIDIATPRSGRGAPRSAPVAVVR